MAEQFWLDQMDYLEDLWKEGIPSDFMQEPRFHGTVNASAGYVEPEMEVIGTLPNLEQCLKEPLYGAPTLVQYAGVLVNPTTVHHIYHIVRHGMATGERIHDAESIIEWGGGWGNMARLFANYLAAPEQTYTVVDLPLMSRVQYEYLVNTTHKHVSFNSYVEGSINVIDTDHLSQLPSKAHGFISTWALSESGRDAQAYVVDRNWFNADRLLLALDPQHQSIFPSTNWFISQIALEDGLIIQPADPAEGSTYVFR